MMKHWLPQMGFEMRWANCKRVAVIASSAQGITCIDSDTLGMLNATTATKGRQTSTA
jgi:hypothetical protein